MPHHSWQRTRQPKPSYGSSPRLFLRKCVSFFLFLLFSPFYSLQVQPKGVDVLILHPFYVKSRMSGFRHTSFFVVSPQEYARKALLYLGRVTVAQPIFAHKLLDWAFRLAPSAVGLQLRKQKMEQAATRLRRRKEREHTPPADNSLAQPGTGTGGLEPINGMALTTGTAGPAVVKS